MPHPFPFRPGPSPFAQRSGRPSSLPYLPPWSPSGPAVGFAGALNPLKGPHFLLDSFKFVEFPCELALLGPSSQDYLKSLEQKTKLCANE